METYTVWSIIELGLGVVILAAWLASSITADRFKAEVALLKWRNFVLREELRKQVRLNEWQERFRRLGGKK